VYVVVIVAVVATGEALVGLIVGVTLHVAGLVGLAGVLVIAQVRFTTPVNPPAGVKVICAVLPVVAPAGKLSGPLFVSAKLGGGFTVTFTTVLELTLPVAASLPVTVTP